MARPEDKALEWRTYGLSFANRLRHLRELRGLSQERLAELSGVHRNQVSNLERNVSRDQRSIDPRLSTIFQLARALQVPPDALIPNSTDAVRRKSSESTSDFAWVSIRTKLDRRFPKSE